MFLGWFYLKMGYMLTFRDAKELNMGNVKLKPFIFM